MISINIGSKNEGRLELEGFYQREKSPGKSTYWRWAIDKKSTIILNGYRLRKRSSILITFQVSPFLVNHNREMILETPLSRTEVKLKPGLNRYEVILDFPSGEDPQIDIFYEKSGSPASLGMSADSRNLSVLWSEIAFRIIDK